MWKCQNVRVTIVEIGSKDYQYPVSNALRVVRRTFLRNRKTVDKNEIRKTRLEESKNEVIKI